MSYSSEIYSSSYRKIFGDAPRSGRVGLGSSSPSRLHSAGYRSSHRTYGSPSAISSTTTYRRTAAPGRVFSSMPDHAVDLTQSTAVTNELKIIRTNEKEQLQGLNDRFVSFIEKVHNLEQQNKILEAEVTLLRQRNSEPSRLHELYEQEIRELRARVEELTHEKSQMHLDCVQMNDTLERMKEKFEEESRLREEAENTLKGYRKDVDDATLARLELEKKVESLLDEIAFLRKVHEEEQQELQASLQATQVHVPRGSDGLPVDTQGLHPPTVNWSEMRLTTSFKATEYHQKHSVTHEHRWSPGLSVFTLHNHLSGHKQTTTEEVVDLLHSTQQQTLFSFLFL